MSPTLPAFRALAPNKSVLAEGHPLVYPIVIGELVVHVKDRSSVFFNFAALPKGNPRFPRKVVHRGESRDILRKWH